MFKQKIKWILKSLVESVIGSKLIKQYEPTEHHNKAKIKQHHIKSTKKHLRILTMRSLNHEIKIKSISKPLI